MIASKDELTTRADFAERYARSRSDAVMRVEREVIGDVWGACGHTTVAQADLLIERLRLTGDDRLLDFGCGRGWPGLYVAKRTGCEVVLADLPLEGLVLAGLRARDEGVRHTGSVVSSARHFPFKPESFDAIVHTDVLC